MDFGVATVTRGACAAREGYIAVAEAAERLGFGFISVNDHVVVPRDIASRYPYSESGEWAARTAGECLDQLNTLAFIAARTERVRLLTSVMVVPQRHPVLTAKMLATIDVLSKGRLIVGCGVGWMKEEFEALGAPPFAERGSATDEYLDAMKALWTQDAPKFRGKHVSFDDVIFAPKPVAKPHPPIWIGGESAVALKRTGARGRWLVSGVQQPAASARHAGAARRGLCRAAARCRGRGARSQVHRRRLPRALACGLDRAEDGRRRTPPVHRQLGRYGYRRGGIGRGRRAARGADIPDGDSCRDARAHAQVCRRGHAAGALTQHLETGTSGYCQVEPQRGGGGVDMRASPLIALIKTPVNASYMRQAGNALLGQPGR
jgi:probable F420-dependent oxidoreductase